MMNNSPRCAAGTLNDTMPAVALPVFGTTQDSQEKNAPHTELTVNDRHSAAMAVAPHAWASGGRREPQAGRASNNNKPEALRCR